MTPCGPKRVAILDFCRAYLAEHKTFPTHREIGAAVGLKSTATIHHHVSRLVVAGSLSPEEVNRYRTTVSVARKALEDIVDDIKMSLAEKAEALSGLARYAMDLEANLGNRK